MCSEPRHNNNKNRKMKQLLLPAGGGGTKCIFLEPVCAYLCACVCSWVCVGHLTLAQLCDSFLANGAITHARLSCESSRLYAIKIFTRHRQRGQLCESSLLATHTHTCIHALTNRDRGLQIQTKCRSILFCALLYTLPFPASSARGRQARQV